MFALRCWFFFCALIFPLYVGAQYNLSEFRIREELKEMLQSERIDTATHQHLLSLLANPLDLNQAKIADISTLPWFTRSTARSIIQYRKRKQRIKSIATLSARDIITPLQAQLLGFFFFIGRRDKHRSTRGSIEAKTRWSQLDRGPFPAALRLRLKLPHYIRMGFIGILSRHRLAKVRYDATRDALRAPTPKTNFIVPKAFLLWEHRKFEMIIGSYRIGFGRGLTFDTTSRVAPRGFYPDLELLWSPELTLACKESSGELSNSPCQQRAHQYLSQDFKAPERMLGIVIQTTISLSSRLELSSSFFGSYQPKGIYQYEIYDRSKCSDPRDDSDPDCRAPMVFRSQNDLLAPTSTYRFQTLSRIWIEQLAGAHLRLLFKKQAELGLSGYGAKPRWLVSGIDLDFQETSRFPYGGAYGALGIDGIWRSTKHTFSFEITKSFDAQPERGGIAAIIGHQLSLTQAELVFELRYFGISFANPYARTYSQADEYEGLRSRDEMGMRTRLGFSWKKEDAIRVDLDLWRSISSGYARLKFNLQYSQTIAEHALALIFFDYYNKDLRHNGRETCFEGSPNRSDETELAGCRGEKIQLGMQLRWSLQNKHSLSWEVSQRWLDAIYYDQRFRRDVLAIFVSRFVMASWLQLGIKLRYRYEDIGQRARHEHSIRMAFDTDLVWRTHHRLRLHYDFLTYLDQRASIRSRQPNPEHGLRVDYVASF